MAGSAKPESELIEAKYTLLDGLGVNTNQNGEGLFDGVQLNEWSTSRTFYFNTNNTGFVKVNIESDFRIWRSGTTGWSIRHQPINIKRLEADGSETDFTSYHLQTSGINENEWEVFTKEMPAGTYVFGLGYWGTGEYRIDSEWFIEQTEHPVLGKILLSNPEKTLAFHGARSDFKIPKFTSFEQDGFLVESSSDYNQELQGWKAFDGDYTTAWGSSANIEGAWLKILFNGNVNIEAIKIYRLPPEITSSFVVSGQPRDFDIQVTEDGESWRTIVEARNETDWTMKSKTYPLRDKVKALGIRILIINNNGSRSYVGIGEVEVLGEYANAIAELTSQSEQDFIDYGMSPQELSDIDFTSEFTEKHYINNQSTPLGEGKVFTQPLDVDKVIKKVNIK